MNTAYMTTGGKGGVGKSLTAMLLADYLKRHGIPFLAFDCDTENMGKASAFSSHYPDAIKVNLRSTADCDMLLTRAAESEISIIDLPANASGDFMSWWESVATPETLEALDLKVTAIGTLTPEPGTFASVASWAEILQDGLDYIIALNHRTQQRVQIPKEQVFPEYFSSKVGDAFRSAFHPRTFEIPGLYEGSMGQLAKSGQLPSEAANNPAIPLLDRTRIKTWASKIHTQLAEIL